MEYDDSMLSDYMEQLTKVDCSTYFSGILFKYNSNLNQFTSKNLNQMH